MVLKQSKIQTHTLKLLFEKQILSKSNFYFIGVFWYVTTFQCTWPFCVTNLNVLSECGLFDVFCWLSYCVVFEVGDIVKVSRNQELASDMVMLASEDSDGSCYITTANLDGETSLKVTTSSLLQSVRWWSLVQNESKLFGYCLVNSQAILTKFCNHFYLIIWQHPTKFQWVFQC